MTTTEPATTETSTVRDRATRFHVALSPQDMARPHTTGVRMDDQLDRTTFERVPLEPIAWQWQVFLGHVAGEVCTYVTASQAHAISEAWAEVAADIASMVHAQAGDR